MGGIHQLHTSAQVLERLAGIPGGPELLDRARRRDGVSLIGGAVRDLLLGHWPRELDVSVPSDAPGFARDLAEAVSPSERAYGRTVEPVLHERFGTASVVWQYGRIDIAQRRAESYSAPGALPEVRPGTAEEDLARRDFTVNAISLPLHGRESEGLLAVPEALEDLRAGRLRVLHERSFIDDPTRILRLARYAARLGFEVEPQTRELAVDAVQRGALETVSGARIGAELWLAAGEASGAGAFTVLDGLAVLAALGLPTPFDSALAAQARTYLPHDGEQKLLLMAVALHPAGLEDDGSSREADASLVEIASRLDFARDARDRVLASSISSASLARNAAELPPGAVWTLLDSAPLEAASIAAVLAARCSGDGSERIREWIDTQRHVRLEIDGGDLLKAGVPEGPEVGLRLLAALRRKREGAASGRGEELRAALEAEIQQGAPIETGP